MYLSCDSEPRSLRPAFVDGDVFAIVGGAGHHMGDAAAPDRWEALAAWTEAHFGSSEVTHRWATHDLIPTDHVPFIGNLGPRVQRRWVATGFAKWGMTNGYVAANIISRRIGGGSTPWSSAFDSTLRCLHSHSRPPLGGRDRDVCVLREDRALGTWDCPCHGSRFDEDGNVIQGPANRPLV